MIKKAVSFILERYRGDKEIGVNLFVSVLYDIDRVIKIHNHIKIGLLNQKHVDVLIQRLDLLGDDATYFKIALAELGYLSESVLVPSIEDELDDWNLDNHLRDYMDDLEYTKCRELL
jgi:hypothetical protein